MTPRLLVLFLRSRLTASVIGLVAATTAAIWLALALSARTGGSGTVVILAPVIPAMLIAASTRSPFGDVERSAGSRLAALRFVRLTCLFLASQILLALAAHNTAVDQATSILLRNLAGYAGFAFLGARLFGAEAGWLAAALLGVVAAVAHWSGAAGSAWWQWPAAPADHGTALLVASVLLATGFATLVIGGPRRTDPAST